MMYPGISLSHITVVLLSWYPSPESSNLHDEKIMVGVSEHYSQRFEPRPFQLYGKTKPIHGYYPRNKVSIG
jgi:hypothetical protein